MIGGIIVVLFIIFLIGVFSSTEPVVNRAIYGDEPTIINVHVYENKRIAYEEDGNLYDEEGNEVDEDGNII